MQLIAAVFTPLNSAGDLALQSVEPLVDFLVRQGIDGLYVCGSTGEGPSLTSAERKATAEAFLAAAAGRVRVMVQVGHNSVREAGELAAHAANAGADAVSATCPGYFKPASLEVLVDTMAEIAGAAAGLPFYYYHIPSLTGVPLDMPGFLARAGARIPNLRGMKYTTPQLHEFQACQAVEGGRFELLWGTDEMLLAAAVLDAAGAVGTTYNFASPLYRKMLQALDAGDRPQAVLWQGRAVSLIRLMMERPFLSACKHVLGVLGIPCGPCRLPLPSLTAEEQRRLEDDLQRLGFFQWLE